MRDGAGELNGSDRDPRPARMLPGRRRRAGRIPRGLQQFLVEVMRVLRDPALLLWSLYIFLFPIYVFKSGLPQPGDWLVLPLIPAVFGTGSNRLPGVSIPSARALLLFTAYVFLVNITWTVAEGAYDLSTKTGFILAPLWYLYNALFFFMALILYQRHRERFLWLTLQLVLASVVLQALVSLAYSRGGIRGTVLFNNPNQLGYFAILSASILAFGRRRLGLATMPATIGLMACGYLALLSSSKAALGATAILIIVALFNNPRMIIASSVAFLLLVVFSTPVADLVRRTKYRIETDESLDFFEERGYDRIVNNQQYLFFGAGEGGYRRFRETTAIAGHEIHSSAGTLLFCYGTIGVIMFSVFCVRLIRGSPFRRLLLLMPAAAFGITHQGLRFTLLWVLLAMFLALRDQDLARARASAAAPVRAPAGAHVR